MPETAPIAVPRTEASLGNPAAPPPLLRRDLRRARAAVVVAVAQTVEAAATSTMADAAAEQSPRPENGPVRDEPDAAVTPEAPRGGHTRVKPARVRPAATRTSATAGAAPTSSRPADALPARPRSRSRFWQMTGAALAVATLVGGTAMPAIGLVRGPVSPVTSSTASETSATDLRTQSFTASGDVQPRVVISGEYSATTPDELAERQAVAAATARSGIAPIATPGRIIIPMAKGTYRMTDGFGASRPGRSHMGQDYAAPIGTPIYASADGVVTMSQDSHAGYGATVQVRHDHDGRVTTLYAHMDYGSRAVDVGDRVVAGQFLGRVGNTGYTIGSCLHFEVRINGAEIDPLPWLKAHVR